MDIVKTFGKTVDKWSEKTPGRARALLEAGLEVQGFRLRLFQDKRLNPSDKYVARLILETMKKPLMHSKNAVLVSIFTPCELLEETGLFPFSVETFSNFLSGCYSESFFLQSAEDCGISETLCSFHKTFIGSALSGVMPAPKCIVYTNLACDANLLTFRKMAELYHVPSFAIDVPTKQGEESVKYVAGQLRDLAAFLSDCTGKTVDDDSLRERLKRSRRTQEKFDRYQSLRSDRYVPADLATPLYAGVANNILLGTEGEEKYVDMLLKDIAKAPEARGIRIYWMHIIPYWSQAVETALSLNENAQIVGCELTQASDITRHSDDPYEDMALRMVYNALSGSVSNRIEMGIRHARQAKADGVVWFNHWGCKHTLGGAQLAKKKFEEAGLPLLILDGDACDRSHGGEGQTSTRLGAFLEMLSGGN